MKQGFAVLLVYAGMLLLAADLRAGAWDMDPPVPDDDPRWERVSTLWADHHGGRNLDELISLLNPLRDRCPDRIEPYLWLSRVHHLHARYHRRDRVYHYEKAENYAAKACAMDTKNTLAVRALVDTLFHSRDRAYIHANYGDLIMSCAPLPVGEALPEMKDVEGWGVFKSLWEARADIEKAKQAADLAEAMARVNPTDALVQTWAARANYYVGEYYSACGEHKSTAMPYYRKGVLYAKRARALEPKSIPANYWYQISLARTIQHKWLFVKARYLMDLLTPLLYCCRENSQYYFDGPMVTLGTMITNGGWVTEKGMGLAGVSLELDMNALELAEILNPCYYYIPYCRADILAYQGQYREALEILDRLLARDPNEEPRIPENRYFLKFAKTLRDDIERKQAEKGFFLTRWLRR
ncbi:MAG TPA: hypothetical protein PK213_13670 [Deltaproteobacteria bacterium]|nr:hypothetical protein [Deltaproteobacteria bacterium]